jgi:hypothetical protein
MIENIFIFASCIAAAFLIAHFKSKDFFPVFIGMLSVFCCGAGMAIDHNGFMVLGGSIGCGFFFYEMWRDSERG